MLKEGVGWKDRVVWLDNGSWDLWGGIDSESEFGFLTVVNWKSFEKERSESRSSSSSDGVENEETLETCALIGEFSNSVETEIDNFFTNCVVSSGEVVGGVFLSWDELLRVEKLSVGSSSNFINDSCF